MACWRAAAFPSVLTHFSVNLLTHQSVDPPVERRGELFWLPVWDTCPTAFHSSLSPEHPFDTVAPFFFLFPLRPCQSGGGVGGGAAEDTLSLICLKASACVTRGPVEIGIR